VAQVERHNQNARLVQSLRAIPTVSILSKRNGGSARGILALERPRSFAMRLETTMGRDLANVGSNDTQCWFWTRDSQDPAVYVCSYDEGGTVPPELSFHPDWIVEALGLREISLAEAKRVQSQPGQAPGTRIWTHHRTDSAGRPVIKKTVLNTTTGQILGHYFYAPDNKTILAIATPSKYSATPLPTTNESTGQPANVTLPREIQLRLASPRDATETMSMTIALERLEVNPSIKSEQRAELFAVPHMKGYQLVELNQRANMARTAATPSGSAVSAAASAVGLGEPAPLELDSDSLRRRDPVPLDSDLPGTSQRDPAGTVVGVRLPRAVESPATAIAHPDPWSRSGPVGMER
jgi:hypothetical protein